MPTEDDVMIPTPFGKKRWLFLKVVLESHDDMVAALKEVARNCEPWKQADNMAGRLYGIAMNALPKGEKP